MDPIIVVFGLCVGLLVGMTGIGGGAIMPPLLTLVVGAKPLTAIGTDLFYAAVTKTLGGWRHWRQGTVDMKISGWLAAGSVPGALGGVYVLHLLQDAYGKNFDDLVLYIVAGALAITGVATLSPAMFSRNVPSRDRDAVDLKLKHKVAAVTLGLTIGFVLGVSSAGS